MFTINGTLDSRNHGNLVQLSLVAQTALDYVLIVECYMKADVIKEKEAYFTDNGSVLLIYKDSLKSINRFLDELSATYLTLYLTKNGDFDSLLEKESRDKGNEFIGKHVLVDEFVGIVRDFTYPDQLKIDWLNDYDDVLGSYSYEKVEEVHVLSPNELADFFLSSPC